MPVPMAAAQLQCMGCSNGCVPMTACTCSLARMLVPMAVACSNGCSPVTVPAVKRIVVVASMALCYGGQISGVMQN